jgi:hypothetical protein
VVRRALGELSSALDPDQGTFLFFFAGHGFEQQGSNYLANFGSTAEDLKLEGFPVSEVEAILKGSKAKQSTMFIDACRNDPTAGARSAGARSFASLGAAQGLRVLFSTRAGRVSYESDELQNGIFTHFLVRGLRGEAAGSDGLVTFRDLSGYVVEQVRAYSFRKGGVQVPYEAGESSGDFLLARASTLLRIESAGPKPGEVKVNAKDGQRYVWIPPGKFTMGCSPGDSECYDNEKPAREVEISKGFWLGQTEVTQGAWQRVMGKNPSHFKGSETLPVELIQWDEARD